MPNREMRPMKFAEAVVPICLFALLPGTLPGWCQNPSISIDVSDPEAKISPRLCGRINHAGDGGLYAELIRIRSFEEQTTLGWSLESSETARASMALDTSKPLSTANETAQSSRRAPKASDLGQPAGRKHDRVTAQGGAGDAQRFGLQFGLHAHARTAIAHHLAAEDRQDLRCSAAAGDRIGQIKVSMSRNTVGTS